MSAKERTECCWVEDEGGSRYLELSVRGKDSDAWYRDTRQRAVLILWGMECAIQEGCEEIRVLVDGDEVMRFGAFGMARTAMDDKAVAAMALAQGFLGKRLRK